MDDYMAKLLRQENQRLFRLCVLGPGFRKSSASPLRNLTTGERLLRLPEVLHRTGLSKKTINHLEAAGRLPTCRQLGPRAVGWLARFSAGLTIRL